MGLVGRQASGYWPVARASEEEFGVTGTEAAERLRGGDATSRAGESLLSGRAASPMRSEAQLNTEPEEFSTQDESPTANRIGDVDFRFLEAAGLVSAGLAQRRRSSVPSVYSTQSGSFIGLPSAPPGHGRRATFTITPYSQTEGRERTSLVVAGQSDRDPSRPSSKGSGSQSRPASKGSDAQARPGSKGSDSQPRPGSRDSLSESRQASRRSERRLSSGPKSPGSDPGSSRVEVAGPGAVDAKRVSFSTQRVRGNSGSSAYLQMGGLTPPSAWSSSEKGKEREREPLSITSVPSPEATTYDLDTFGRHRSHSSIDIGSSSGHSQGHSGNPVVASSQGHGSGSGSGSGSHSHSHSHGVASASGSKSQESSSSGSGSKSQRGDGRKGKSTRSKNSNEGRGVPDEAGGQRFFPRPSLSSLRSRFRRSSDSSPPKSPSPRPPQPVSSLQPTFPPRRASSVATLPSWLPSEFTTPHHSQSTTDIAHLAYLRTGQASGPIFGPGAVPSGALYSSTAIVPPRPLSSILRPQSPGVFPNFPPPPAPSALMRSQGPGTGLSVIQASPSPAPTSETNVATPDGLLDPRLTHRLRELKGAQASMSTLGLHDHEDYSRPIGGVSFKLYGVSEGC